MCEAIGHPCADSASAGERRRATQSTRIQCDSVQASAGRLQTSGVRRVSEGSPGTHWKPPACYAEGDAALYPHRPTPHSTVAVAVAVQSAVAQFWELLHEFTQYSKIPGAWRRLLPQDTPFLHFPNVARQLHVNKQPRLILDAG
jgi:hypothetical protein